MSGTRGATTCTAPSYNPCRSLTRMDSSLRVKQDCTSETLRCAASDSQGRLNHIRCPAAWSGLSSTSKQGDWWSVRCFRDVHEVLGYPYTSPDFTRDGLVRLWEEVGKASEVVLRERQRILDRVEIFTRREMEEGEHRRPWTGDGARRQGWSFSGEGFVEKRRGGRWLQLEDPLKKGWRRAGGVEEDYPNMRDPDVLHNTHNLPYIGLPVRLFADNFNAFDMSNPVRNITTYHTTDDDDLFVLILLPWSTQFLSSRLDL
ncbi:unnamed protein product [Ectocarpus sp. 4 AP-2014]